MRIALSGICSRHPAFLVDASAADVEALRGRVRRVYGELERGPVTRELIAKIDHLIGLGDLQEDDISVPVDDMPMEIAEGDVVLDEQVDDDPASSFEHEMQTKSGCTVVFLQYPGPTTGAPAIYDGRMNLKEPESPQEYDLNR